MVAFWITIIFIEKKICSNLVNIGAKIQWRGGRGDKGGNRPPCGDIFGGAPKREGRHKDFLTFYFSFIKKY
jgi:hypothetical protein